MSRPFFFKILIFLTITATIIGGAYKYIDKQLLKVPYEALKTLGFSNVTVTNYTIKDGHVYFMNANIDPEEFSTIKTISAPMTISYLWDTSKIQNMKMMGVSIGGRIDEKGLIDITNWNPLAIKPQEIPDISLKQTIIDLATNVGALRFDIDGSITTNDDKNKKIALRVGAKQYQLKFDSIWQGLINADGRWQYDIDIKSGGFNFNQLSASRVSGWLNLEKSETIFPKIGGQLLAGKFTLSNLTLLSTEITLDGYWNKPVLMIKGKIHGYEDMHLNADLTSAGNDYKVKASIATDSKDDMIDLLQNIHDIRSQSERFSNLSSLMLTQGNIEAVSSALMKIDYDSLVLEITGTNIDLAGKLVAYKTENGIKRKNVISLDPTQR